MKRLEQHQVPDGMVANVPWTEPLNRWSDRMVERGLKHLQEGTRDGEFFPHLHGALDDEARVRGIEVEA